MVSIARRSVKSLFFPAGINRSKVRRGEKRMSGNAQLENKTIEALRHYREALGTIENLEREEACAHRALMIMLTDLDSALLEEGTPSLMRSLFEIGSVAVLRSDEAWTALSEATAKLDLARLTLAALEQQLGYIPGVSIAPGDPA
jgi:hypothetical protein